MRRKLVVLHQHEGPTIEGVWKFSLGALINDEYALVGAKLIEEGGTETTLEHGEVRVPRRRVYFRQLIARQA